MVVGDQLSLDAQRAAALVGGQAQRLDVELHAEQSSAVEEGITDTIGRLEPALHVRPDQIAAEAFGVERLQIVFEEQVQVLLAKLLQPPLWAEERSEVVE